MQTIEGKGRQFIFLRNENVVQGFRKFCEELVSIFARICTFHVKKHAGGDVKFGSHRWMLHVTPPGQ